MTSVEMLQKRKALYDQLLEINKRQDEKGHLASDDQSQWDKLNAEIDSYSASISRAQKVEEIQSKEAEERAKAQETEERAKKDNVTYGGAFKSWVRQQDLTHEERSILKRGTDSQTVGTAEHGGRLVPDEWASNILKYMKYYSGALEAADIVTTTAGNKMYFPVVDETAIKGSLIAEAGADTVSDVTWTLKEMDAYVYTSGLMKVSYELLQDNAYNIEGHLQELAAERLGRIANQHLTTGTGSSQPNGLATASTLGKTAAAVAAVTRDEILDLVHSLDIAYRRKGARFMMNDSTLAAIKKLTVGTADDRPLWQPSIREGEPDRIEGYGYIINNDMEALATGNKTILFGDFSQFKVRMVKGIEWKVLTERYAETRQNGYFAFNRWDSELLDTSAVKHLIQA
jgi:HK97 family phage major capsid protein